MNKEQFERLIEEVKGIKNEIGDLYLVLMLSFILAAADFVVYVYSLGT